MSLASREKTVGLVGEAVSKPGFGTVVANGQKVMLRELWHEIRDKTVLVAFP